ncbi:MAG: hypothetical protein ACRCX2_29605 [Paraclostridium sp.]
MSRKYNNSKSALVLQKYIPEDIQKLLDSGDFKSVIVRTLGVNMKAFNEYIEQHNLTYKPPIKPRVSSSQKQNIKKEQKDSNSYQEPLERFKKLFEERKQKRTLQELKDAYY